MSTAMLVHLLVAVSVLCAAPLVYGEGNTTTPESFGLDVVADVIIQVQESNIFPADHDFLLRLAKAESNYGYDDKTYDVVTYHGGIWQVDEAYFDISKDITNFAELAEKISAINETFGIDWYEVTWEDLRTPLYSGLAASLYLSTVIEPIPQTSVLQQTYYVTYYRPAIVFIDPPWDGVIFIKIIYITPWVRGVIVVREVIWIIDRLNIFVVDWRFLFRIACVETNFGHRTITFHSGGIWQLSYPRFLQTQNIVAFPGLVVIHQRIRVVLGIDWRFVVWQDLLKPLYSGLAARIYLHMLSPRWLPRTIKGQARFWAGNYNPGSSIPRFLDLVALHGDPHLTQMIRGSEKPLCYDVFGKDGEIYNFLDEPAIDLRITASLKSEPKKARQHPGEYVGRVSAFIGLASVHVNTEEAVIGNNIYNWSTHVNMVVDDGIHLKVNKHSMLIDFYGVVWLQLKRMFKPMAFLELNIKHIGKLSDSAYGILGDVAKHAEIIEKRNGTNLMLTNADKTMSTFALHEGTECWKLIGHHTNKARQFKDLMNRNKLNCLSC